MIRIIFKNFKNINSLIANKIKTNICLVSVQLFIVRPIFYDTVPIYITHTTSIHRSVVGSVLARDQNKTQKIILW